MKGYEMKERIVWHPKRADNQELEDAASLIQSFQEEESARRSHNASYYRWKLLNNPAGEGAMWIVQDEGRVTGTASFTPKRLKIGTPMPGAAEIGDTFTHPDYQRKGIFSTLVKSVRADALDNDIEFIYGTPNQNSLPGYEKKLNFPQIPGVGAVNLIRPLQMERVAKGRLGDTWKAKIMEIGMRLVYATRYRPQKTSGVMQITTVDAFPPEIDSLWDAVADAYDVIIVRDLTYLEWRFGTNPDEYTIWIVRDNSQQLLGYIVTKPGLWRGLKVLYIADYLTMPGQESIFDEALSAILQHAQSQGADMVSCWSVEASEHARVLKNCGFLRFRDVPIICYANELGKRVICADYKWYFTMADSDNI